MVHTSVVTLRDGSSEGDSVGSIGESEYEDIQAETKLEDCASVEMEMRNREVGVKYEGWRGGALSYQLINDFTHEQAYWYVGVLSQPCASICSIYILSCMVGKPILHFIIDDSNKVWQLSGIGP